MKNILIKIFALILANTLSGCSSIKANNDEYNSISKTKRMCSMTNDRHEKRIKNCNSKNTIKIRI